MTVTGAHLRDVGIERVLATSLPWRERYSIIILEWFEKREDGFRFTGETLREVAKEHGLEEPRHHNVWGGAASVVIRALLREKKIWITGSYVAARSPKTHAHALRQYEKIVKRRYRFADDEDQLTIEGL